MLIFEQYVKRHGEFGVQAIIELIERQEGIQRPIGTSLEDRWDMLMQGYPVKQQIAA